MTRLRRFAAAAALGAAAAVLPIPAIALSVPETLADVRALGSIRGTGPIVTTPFAADFVAVSWTRGDEPSIRFLSRDRWTAWREMHTDELPGGDGRTFSSLVPAGDASAYQLRGRAAGVRAVVINTTDGRRALRLVQPEARASHLTQPALVSRAAWGADESLRFLSDGSEDWPQTFYATQKLIVHHTATDSADPDPAATVRAIYRYHAVDRGFGDIGYNFLVDADGRVYKGRYSGPVGTTDADTPTGEDAAGHGVTAAHTGGWNSGTMGIAVLGTYTSTAVPAAARATLVDHLAWEAERHGIDPTATTEFTNPVSGERKTNANISGHRDWVATECPGGTFSDALPSIRSDVDAKMDADTTPPSAPANLTAKGGKRKISLAWTASSDDRGVAGYEIRRASSSSGPFSKIATTTATTYTNGGLARRATYWYEIVAYDGAGNRSAPSNRASATAS